MQTIRFSGRTPSPERLRIGMETDSRTESLRFHLPQIADGQIATLQMILPDGTAETLLIDSGMTEIPARVTEIAGTARAWVEILAGDVMAWHSGMMYLGIGELPEISERTEQQYPTFYQQVIAITGDNMTGAQAAREAAEAAQEKAEDALDAAWTAAGLAMASGGILHFYIDEAGDLHLVYTDRTPYTFELKNGRLYVHGRE